MRSVNPSLSQSQNYDRHLRILPARPLTRARRPRSVGQKTAQESNSRAMTVPKDKRSTTPCFSRASARWTKRNPSNSKRRFTTPTARSARGSPGYIAQKYSDTGLKDKTIVATFEGSAGQSFGAFCINGMQLNVFGEANDYVGKSMGGGEIVIRPPTSAKYATNENAIIGNTVLYGATGGTLYAAGLAGERFCVRNSGAVAVVEGVGDHACEYMTGGTVVISGRVWQKFWRGHERRHCLCL